MRTIPGPLLAALTASPRRSAECVVLQARDGSLAGFTTWSGALEIDLSADGGPGPVSCTPRMTLSATTLAVGFEASTFELTGACRGEFSGAKVRGGKWRGAKAWQVRVSPGVDGYAPIMRGKIGEGRVEGRSFTLEVRNAGRAWNQSQGSVLGPWCRADFGNAETGCPVVREAVPCTVTAVESSFVFAVDLGGEYADNWFFLGSAAFLTGDLAGTAEIKVFAYDGDTGGVQLFEPLVEVPQLGDTLNLFRGCSKLIKHDNPIIPTCSGYGAGESFVGEPEVPGSRYYHRMSAPGAAYA